MSQRNFALFELAKAADEAFQTELVRVYGVKKACKKRYQIAPYFEDSLNDLKDAKIAADALWLDEMQRNYP